MKHLTDKTAVVTGAASGIGRATARAFAEAGCRLAMLDVDSEGLDETRESIESTRPDCRILSRVVDVSEPAAVEEFADAVAVEFDEINVLVNNAGINVTGTFEQHTLEDFDRTFDVNVRGVIHGCKFMLPYLREADRGHIVNISSIFGIVGTARQAAYSASKFAVRGLSETLHEELADTSVDVTVVHPGCIDTAIIRDATIHEAGDAEQMREYFSEYGRDPRVVADRIVDAVRHRKHRLLVTPESHILDLLRRIAPTLGNRLANWVMGNLL